MCACDGQAVCKNGLILFAVASAPAPARVSSAHSRCARLLPQCSCTMAHALRCDGQQSSRHASLHLAVPPIPRQRLRHVVGPRRAGRGCGGGRPAVGRARNGVRALHQVHPSAATLVRVQIGRKASTLTQLAAVLPPLHCAMANNAGSLGASMQTNTTRAFGRRAQ